ncbi:MAG: PhnD/SsuA/transferrin family substrate-binding protein [Micavibrio aeruginosavorus]|uniref:PhnD/SsuA/transferrin family substrate-binding protein n=1 Tax=Micavibrio aeruginosavorus TaxID=349221 RepID=A0A7T5R0Q2_9BACT|nr:MAG: PhnD/SsuA/transferrin family substrate-binding protein [Micavibrio aeruginosavorus]
MSTQANCIFSACPHDVILDPEKWQAVVNYLHAKKVFDGHFERHTSFSEFAENFSRFDLAYAHPLDAVDMVRRHGFTPIAKYENVYDEAVVITQKLNNSPSFEAATRGLTTFVNGSPSHAAFLIEAHDRNIPIGYQPVPKDNYQEVLMDVALNVAEYGVILRSVYDDMLVMRDNVVVSHTTSTKKLVHVFAVSPRLKDKSVGIQNALLHMHEDPAGQAILARLKCGRIVPFGAMDIDKLESDLSVCVFEEI